MTEDREAEHGAHEEDGGETGGDGRGGSGGTEGVGRSGGTDGVGGPSAADGPSAAGAAGGPGEALTGRERELLAVERRSWPGPGAKERAVRERLGLSPTHYYQLLNALLDDPRALAHDPVTVNRLRRVREERQRRR
ncbi:DUF3263 domain-containing protein [Streptomyces sp. NPDC001744]|uniref:DUF3263 domain-containing protein n=1 Tax=Streptomyces sp. NPDC001744 TaxID=3364606 RepID=UPI003680C559